MGIGLFVLPVILADGRELLRTAASIELRLLALPAALTLLSYAAMSRSYQTSPASTTLQSPRAGSSSSRITAVTASAA